LAEGGRARKQEIKGAREGWTGFYNKFTHNKIVLGSLSEGVTEGRRDKENVREWKILK
jgi:hypothetical protein